ncbi:sensor histidine kinase [Kordiimonas laminariae]|uniref:sensor histidine kinase n=1 Tax=Kordiimonas laminariae TaxID=2917717 RepID=UPI001FF514D7|nr:histidine kinase [Kordiimonas laminariae]MCK0070710.1 histidine kinase [Kordiimonas laminariae]
MFMKDGAGLTNYLYTLTRFTLELGPIVLLLSTYSPKTIERRWIYRLIILLTGPAILMGLANQSHTAPYVISDIFSFLLLWLIYGIEYVNGWFSARQKNQIKFNINLDNALFSLAVIASFIAALFLGSHPEAIYNQPIPLEVNFRHIFENIPTFVFFWFQMLLLYMCLYVLYYINHHVLINHFLSKHGVVAYVFAGFMTLIILYPPLTYIALNLPISGGSQPLTPSGDDNIFSIHNFNMGFAALAGSLPLILAFKWQENSRQLSEAGKRQLEAELTLLQQQINPHFLFNSLNSLYALTLTKSVKAPEAVLQLAGLFRYVVYKGDKERVPLTEEFTYLQDYLALQQLRMGEDCQFNIHFGNTSSNHTIAPLMLIVFIENAFKHGLEGNNKNSWLHISASMEDNKLTFICENSILRNHENSTPGIGLENVRKRLNLQYKDQHTLNITKMQDRFCISLVMDL